MVRVDEMDQVLHENAEALAAVLVQEQSSATEVEPAKMRQSKICLELEGNAHRLEQKMYDGLQAIISALDRTSELPMSREELIQELRRCMHPIQQARDLAQLGQKLLSGVSWKVQLGLSDQCMKTLYQGARVLFEEKRYSQAEKAFFVICAFDPTQYAYWVGLGHSSFQEKDYAQAINAYTMASTLDSDSVWPHIWAANTFEAMKDFQYATMALHDALALLKTQVPNNIELMGALEARITAIA